MSQKTFTFLVGILAPPTLRTFWAELVKKFTPLSKEISCCCQNICIVHNFMVVMFTILFYRDLVIEKCLQVFGRPVFKPVHQLMFLLLLLVVVAAIVFAMTKLLL